MKIALDPYMFRRVPLTDLPGFGRGPRYSYIELSARARTVLRRRFTRRWDDNELHIAG